MKRSRVALVSYSGSSSEDEPEPVRPAKRKLPELASVLTVPTPVDDPAKHQGRLRSFPHVEGQWPAYAYIAIPLHTSETRQLAHVVQRAFLRARSIEPRINSMKDVELEKEQIRGELHVSLTRPFFLRAHQREELKLSVKHAIEACKR
jgi:U6 snRNA phosphodiesterase